LLLYPGLSQTIGARSEEADEGAFLMKATILLLGAATLALAPAFASAQTSPPGNGQYNGNNYWHLNSGNANGQPGASCEDAGVTPGNAGSAPGGGSPFTGEDSKAGQKYAGSQPQNSRNTASVSQYDVACVNQLPK
jgi:hypothetical protein